jgi:hypothetical protein
MIGRTLLIIAAGLFCVWLGLRSISGYEAETEHLYGGRFEPITCEDGNATEGKGLHAITADVACDAIEEEQRGRAPWWIMLGIVVTGVGMIRFRRARS